MSTHIALLGRQPAISIAELEAIFGPDCLKLISKEAVEISSKQAPALTGRLGGIIKLCTVFETLPTDNPRLIEQSVIKLAQRHTTEGKLKIGISAHNLRITPGKLNAMALSVKKELRSHGQSVRIIPNKSVELSSATVLHNHLTKDRGLEIYIIRGINGQILIAKTVYVQDIEAYTARDRERPMRDARVGMLPPKLAQIIINLSSPKHTPSPAQPRSDVNSDRTTILDPFCGTGVLLQESLLMGYDAYGSDIEPRMIEYSQKNLEWLNVQGMNFDLEVGDATAHTWSKDYQRVACETYLGRPLNSLPDAQTLQKIMSDCDTIHRKFLINMANQTKTALRLCLAVPAWKTKNGFLHLKTLDSLEELGYNRVRFVHAKTTDLIYHRDDQVVGRELVVLERK